MPNSARAAETGSNVSRRGLRAWLGLGAIAAAALVTVVAVAFGASSALTLGSASSSMLGKPVVVNAQGRTLYALSPETSRHLLCRSAECFKVWPPLTVKSSKAKLKAASGVQGHLGVIRRSNGTLQVTLRGEPLYRFSGDSAKGQAHGQGIESFGGKWHAMTASSSEATSAPATPPSMQPEAPGYPASAPAPSAEPGPPVATTTPTTPTTTTPAPPPYTYPAY
jgi:predicted lipoprotein with Yx(FWY)xxD motif